MSVYDGWMSVYDEWMQWVYAKVWMFSVYGECRVDVGVLDCKKHNVCHVIYGNYYVLRYTSFFEIKMSWH